MVSGTRGREFKSPQARQIPSVFTEKIYWTHFAASGFGTFRNNKPSRSSIARRCDNHEKLCILQGRLRGGGVLIIVDLKRYRHTTTLC